MLKYQSILNKQILFVKKIILFYYPRFVQVFYVTTWVGSVLGVGVFVFVGVGLGVSFFIKAKYSPTIAKTKNTKPTHKRAVSPFSSGILCIR